MIYSEIISLNERFQPAYDLENEMKDYWKTFIPNKKFYRILSATLNALESNRAEDRQSLWIQGTYGTGKSHAAAVIKHLLSDDPKILDDFEIKESQLAARLRSFRGTKRIFPVVIKEHLVLQILESSLFLLKNLLKKHLKLRGTT